MRAFVGLAVAIVVVALTSGVAVAQGPYGGENLPAGVQSVAVSGLTLNLVTTPTIGDRQPTITGTVDQSAGTIQLGGASQTPTTATVSVGADGSFSHKLGAPLELGKHDVFINGVRVGSFNVVDQPEAPIAGTASGGKSISPTWVTVGGLLTALSLVAGGGYVLSRRRRA